MPESSQIRTQIYCLLSFLFSWCQSSGVQACCWSLPPVDVGSSASSTVSSSGVCFVACELHNLAYNDYTCDECVQISFLGILCTVQHNNYIVLSYINYYISFDIRSIHILVLTSFLRLCGIPCVHIHVSIFHSHFCHS